MRMRTVTALLLALAVAAGAWAQGNPTGVIRGAVTDPDGLALPGVTVTVASPALQGARTVVTSANGDFIIPFLPPGEYTVTVELQGFATQKQTIGVAMAETRPMEIKLAVASVTETVTVTGSTSTEVLKTGTIAADLHRRRRSRRCRSAGRWTTRCCSRPASTATGRAATSSSPARCRTKACT